MLIQKEFLQIRIRESDPDAIHFHWIKNRDINQIEILRFCKPFALEADLGGHIWKYQDVHKSCGY